MLPSAPLGTFRRGLDPFFSESLRGGSLRPLTDAIQNHGLDLQIRDNYIDIYDGGNSVLNLHYLPRLKRFRASIHQKFNPPPGFVSGSEPAYSERLFARDDAGLFVAEFNKFLPRIRKATSLYNKAEGLAEFGIACNNRQAPFVVLDRQVQLGGQRDSRVDVFGLSLDPLSPSVVLLELKYGSNLAADVLSQVDRYRVYYDYQGKLRRDVADSLEEALTLKSRLGLIQGGFPHHLRDLPLDYLVILAGPGAAEKAIQRVIAPEKVHYLSLKMGDLRIPGREHWMLLRGPRAEETK